MTADLWVKKYEPKKLSDYVFKDDELRAKVDQWLRDGALPHLLLSGRPGTGKTSLANLLLNLLEIPRGDILYINASRERKVDDIQDKIGNFVTTWALGPSGIKYVILDEADAISPLAQKMLRADMQDHSQVCRFILTANYPQKIIEPIHGRCQTFSFTELDKGEFITRIGEILSREDVEFDVEHLMTYADAAYPDLRKAINMVEKRTIGGRLLPPEAESEDTKDYLIDMVTLFDQKKFGEARKLIVAQAQPEEYPDIYRWLYRNVHVFGVTENQQNLALMVLGTAVYRHALAADAEINLSATLAELTMIAQQ
jgi:replication factor C small subunit